LIKLIHPDGEVSKDELAEYLSLALEMRRRVKEQLRRINPTEFPHTDLSYIDRASGQEFSPVCPEMGETESGRTDNPPDAQPAKSGRAEPEAKPLTVFHGYELLRS